MNRGNTSGARPVFVMPAGPCHVLLFHAERQVKTHESQRKVCLCPQLSPVTAAFVRLKSLLGGLAVSKVTNIGEFHILKLFSSAPQKCHGRPKSPHDFWMFALEPWIDLLIL